LSNDGDIVANIVADESFVADNLQDVKKTKTLTGS